ncbi:MAG: hypothetical protein OQK46_02415 [Gammaproteobacteria bacterium]|nr:hypothetical protein [Gammaproteobacteria bacterium]
MSLLLDALKKAADDKIKNTANNTSAGADDSTKDSVTVAKTEIEQDSTDNLAIGEPANTDITQTESLELELDFEAETTDTTSEIDKAINDDFPQVDDTVITKADKEPEPEKTTDVIDEINSNDLDDSPLDLTEEKNSLESSTVIDNEETPNSENVIVSNDENVIDNNSLEEDIHEKPEITADTTPQSPAKPTIDRSSSNHAQQRASKKIENEQALSALINKSNQYSRSEKLKKNITIAILITLILIGSALYFYIEMQTTSQDLYITQNSSAVNREADIQNVIPPPAQPLSPPKQNIVKPANTTSQIKPVTKPPVINKPRVTQKARTQPISFVRTNKPDPIHVLLGEAYKAFHNEDYRKSESLYKKVKTREPKNRDALLGLAAIGIKEKRFEYARQKYQYLLKLNPRDSLAIAGISSIESRVDPQLNESQLKFMLKQQPDSAHLYFALGSQYSSQNKWAEAQSAFFSAWSAENKNADYAYNLAVSLDHLDKKKQALDFYQLSLKLKQASSGNFSKIDTEQRIHTLQGKSL